MKSSSRRAGIRISVKEGKGKEGGVRDKAEARKLKRQEARRQKKGLRGRRRRKDELQMKDRYRTGLNVGTDKRLTRVQERAGMRRDQRRRGDQTVAWSSVGMTPSGLVLLKRRTKDGRILFKKAPGDKSHRRDRLEHRGRDTRTPRWRGKPHGKTQGKHGTHRLRQRKTGQRLHAGQNQVL